VSSSRKSRPEEFHPEALAEPEETFWGACGTFSPEKSDCGKVSRVRHMVPGGSRESLPERKVRLADQPEVESQP